MGSTALGGTASGKVISRILTNEKKEEEEEKEEEKESEFRFAHLLILMSSLFRYTFHGGIRCRSST